MELSTMLYVALGGSIGAVLRYLIANLGQSMTTTSFPLGTLVVNVLGCAAIGLITAIVIGPFAQHKEVLRLFLIVGVLGGFTTFSSFAFDALELVDDGRSSQALIYILLTNVLGIGFALFMYRGASLLFNGTSS